MGMREDRLHFRALIVLMLFFCVCALALYISGKYKKYNGKTIAEWVEQLQSEDAGESSEAFNEIESIGEIAVPELADALKNEDPKIRKEIVFLLGAIGGRKATRKILAVFKNDDSVDIKSQAAEVLGKLGDKSVINTLRRNFWNFSFNGHNPFFCATIANALHALGYPIYDELLAELNNNDDADRKLLSIYVLGWLRYEPAVNDLITLLEDQSPSVRCIAAQSLGWIKSQAAVSHVKLLLDDNNPSVRSAAIFALRTIEDKSAMARIIELTLDEYPNVRQEAVSFLGAFGDAAVIPALKKCLSDKDDRVRLIAAIAMGHIKYKKGNDSEEIQESGNAPEKEKERAGK